MNSSINRNSKFWFSLLFIFIRFFLEIVNKSMKLRDIGNPTQIANSPNSTV